MTGACLRRVYEAVECQLRGDGDSLAGCEFDGAWARCRKGEGEKRGENEELHVLIG